MKSSLMTAAMCVLGVTSTYAFPVCAQDVGADVIDPIIVALQREIAKSYGYNMLTSPEDGAAEIGKVYYVTSPACDADLIRMAQQGAGMQIFDAMDLPAERIPAIRPRTQWVHVRIGSALGKQTRAQLQASYPGKKAELGLAFEAIDQSNAQVFFGSRSVGSVAIKQAMEEQLREKAIADPAALGNQAVGAVAPHAVLLVQKFEFDRNAVKRRHAGLAIGILELFGARLSHDKDVSGDYSYQLPTYSTLAFKPVTALFRP